MATQYSNYYTLSTNGRSYIAVAPNNRRVGDPVWYRASVTLPAGTVATDVAKLFPVVSDLRLVGGFVSSSAVNGTMTISLGYTGAATALLNASTLFQMGTQTALTAVQIMDANTLSTPTEVIATVGGTFTNPTTLIFLLQFVNLNS